MADASRGWKFTRKSALRTWHAHVALRKSSTASSAEVASVVDRARSGNGHEKLQHRVGFDGLRFDDESGPRADAASRERRPSRKVRMQSVDLHYQTHGNDVHRASCACRAWNCVTKRAGTRCLRASCASQSVNLRNQTPGVGFLAKFEHAECVPALSNTINIALHAHGTCRLNCTAKHKAETLNKEK